MSADKKAPGDNSGVEKNLKTQQPAANPLSEKAMTPERPSGGPPYRINFWGGSGRQSQLQVRTLMQLRAFHK